MSSSLRRKLSMTISKSDRKNATFKVVILGQGAVGKTALTVKFMTRRFIWDYDPNLESKYSFASTVDGEPVQFEIIDTAGQEEGSARIEENIKWADGFILVYSITDSSSLFSCDRYKFLVNNYARRKKKSAPGNVSGGGGGGGGGSGPAPSDWPVALVGNKNDLGHERAVPREVGEQAAIKLSCTHFHDISVRESYEDVKKVFDDLYRYYRNPKALAKRTASSSDTTVRSSPKEDDGRPAEVEVALKGKSETQSSSIRSSASVSDGVQRHVRARSTFIDGAVIQTAHPPEGKCATGEGAAPSNEVGSTLDDLSATSPSSTFRRTFFDGRSRRKYKVAEADKAAGASLAVGSATNLSIRQDIEECV